LVAVLIGREDFSVYGKYRKLVVGEKRECGNYNFK
jgi:hypothetical protein